MRKHDLSCRLFCTLTLLFGFHIAAWAQEARISSRADVSALLKNLKHDEDEVAFQAAEKLRTLGKPAVSPLNEFLKNEKDCRSRVLAAQVLLGLAPESDSVVPSMLNVLKDGCYFSPRKDSRVRQEAASVLTNTAAGIGELAELLRDKSFFGRFERRSAVFAFDELTEKIEAARPDGVTPTPEVINATKAAIPALIQALADEDKIVHCMAYESLEQLRASRHKELRDEANKLMPGIEARCSR